VIAASDAFAPATFVACVLGLGALPIWWRAVRRRDRQSPAAPPPPPLRPIDAVWPVPVGMAVFVFYLLLSAAALHGIQQGYIMTARLAAAGAVVLGLAASAFALPRLTRSTVAIPAAVGYGLLTFLAVLPVVYGIAYLEALIFGELAPQTMVQKIANGEEGVRELVFLAVAVAPFLEELVFRGLFYGGLRRSSGPRYALVFSSLLFGIVHFDPPVAILPMVALGLFLGMLMERTGSLLACFVAHSAFNSLTVGVLVFG